MFNQDEVAKIKAQYPPGTRVELIRFNDPYVTMGEHYHEGQRGTVRSVDDGGTIFVNWSGGGSLGLIMGEDAFKKVNE